MYQEAIVTFLDILGFGEIVKTKRSEKVDKILNIVERYTVPDPKYGTGYIPEVITFSDSATTGKG